ncbi:hypothetical protein [Pseudomonas helmanticensis]|jgi:hypothetical protein|uniref:hypothetical protein n=1 Tax=Pseudomonas helmanticensis TaxID=1471381 RepID=UPI00381CE84D
MKNLWIVLVFAIFCRPLLADPKKVVLDCPFPDGTSAALLASSSEDGQQLFVMIGDNVDTAFPDMPDTNFVGDIVLARCSGASLIYALNYGSPYLKGAVVRKNPKTKTLERIDFAEKALPSLLYLNAQQMRLVIPNEGYEDPSKFLVYDYIAIKGQPEEPKGVNTLPGRKGFEVFDLK